ncbi:MAG TPA: hypothetical protein VNL71_10780 [Chloroflexota bacterium]|nr:hypothetical protein [Chloroflexota bacterium]
MGHDQYFKELLKGYFHQFLSLFLPEIARRIDPESIEFLDTTDFTDHPEGEQRIADLMAKVRALDGSPETVIVHTEIESEPEGEFGYRMWEYNALATLRLGPPVISIALLPFIVGQGIELARYTETVLGRVYTRLEYWRIPLRGMDAGYYLAADVPMGMPLAALMRPDQGSSVDLKVAIYTRLWREDLAPGTRAMFFNFVQTYLRLTDDEYAEFLRRTAPEGDVTMETLERTWLDEQIERGIEEHAPWADKLVERGIAQGVAQGMAQGMAQGVAQGIAQGVAQGMAQGALQAKRGTLVRQIRARFSTTPADLEERLAHLDEQALDRLIDRVVIVATSDELLAGL